MRNNKPNNDIKNLILPRFAVLDDNLEIKGISKNKTYTITKEGFEYNTGFPIVYIQETDNWYYSNIFKYTNIILN